MRDIYSKCKIWEQPKEYLEFYSGQGFGGSLSGNIYRGRENKV